MMQPLDSPAIRFEIATERAGRGGDPTFCTELDELAKELQTSRPAEMALIGLDLPVTLHVAPVFSAMESSSTQLLEMIRARPWERHIVLLTGQWSRDPVPSGEREAWQIAVLKTRVADCGGAALAPDPSLGGWDRWLWLMAKLDALAAQRLVIHLTPEDLAARLAARLMRPRYGRRLYLFQQADQPVDPLPGVTHLVKGLAERRALRAHAAEDLPSGEALRIGVLPPAFRRERPVVLSDLPAQPPPPGPGRRAALRWYRARANWRIRWLRARIVRGLGRSTPVMKARTLSDQLALGAMPPAASADPARFARRLEAIIGLSEGRLAKPPGSEEPSEVVAMSALSSAPGASLFDATFYLGQLPSWARAGAARNPLAHYLAVGEARGYHPHPLFDPRMAELAMSRMTGAVEQRTEPKRSLLEAYLTIGGAAQPHQFFDPSHYLRQLPMPPKTAAVLSDFLDRGLEQGLSPHPLVEVQALTAGGSADFRSVFMAWLRGDHGFYRSAHPLFDPETFSGQSHDDRLRHAAPNLLWAHMLEGNLCGCRPHSLIWPEEVEKTRPGTLVSAVTVLDLIARNRLGLANPHPLVSTAHLLSQAGWLAQINRHPLRHFLENGVAENLDPHPWFSTQFYFYLAPDVAQTRWNPLLHYLSYGFREGRQPIGFFNGPAYFHRLLAPHVRAGEKHQPELVDYVLRGAGLFWSTLDQEDGLRRLRLDTAIAQFTQCPADSSGVAAKLLREAMHPPTGSPHPALHTETRRLCTETPAPGEDVLDIIRLAPGETIALHRPPVLSPRHVSAPSGEQEVPAIDAAVYSQVTVVAGNDGFITASGVWQDHGLAGFDPNSMEPKGNAAVVALSGGHVLLRRYDGSQKIPTGIFCCGSYSKNYYHFLIETLPRALFAARLAPPGTPVLTDDDMPDQHYQALRLMLPGNPILRLARHRSYRVERLWAGSMPNTFADAFLQPDVPVDAVRVHPAILQLYGDLARRLWPDEADRSRLPRRLFLRRTSRWRQLLNAEALISELARRDFKVCDTIDMGFADQIRLLANADAVVGQSGGQFANIVFARPGARIFPLFSNAPGSNYNLWPVLGTPLGVEVINVVGWRVPGSTGGAAPEAHEHFTVPPHLVTAFFPLPIDTKKAADCLDALHQAGRDAETLTSAWAVTAEATPEGFESRLIALRRAALAAIDHAPEATLAELLDHPFFSDPWASLKSGQRAIADHDEEERAAIARVQAEFARLCDPAADKLPIAQTQRLVLVAMLLLPAWKVELVARPEMLPAPVQRHYLRWIAQPPYLFRAGEDEGYVAYCARLLDWISRQLGEDRPAALRAAVAQMAANLDMGQLFLIDAPLGAVFAARNRVLEHVAVRHGTCRAQPRPADGSQGRRRIGVLFRTFDKGPDSEAVVAMFRAFPRDRYEIFGYSVGFQDRVVSADSLFDREMDAAIEHRRLLSSNATEMRAQILADDLDLFVFANATTYGIQAQELALYHRVAPVQVAANSHLPQPLGFPSFDAYLTGQSDHPDHEIDQADYSERLLRRKGPVICYMHSLKPRPRPPLDRAALGLRPEDVVMFNAGSLQKLRRECLMAMMQAVKDVPNGLLMLAPYNPGWAGRAQAFPFNHQLAATAAEVGLDPARIKVLSELTVAESEAALACSDIYLTPFPHGGATMLHLALIYGVPPVVLRRRSARSIDQFLVESLGLGELLVDEPSAYVALAQSLATNKTRRQKLSEKIRKVAARPSFVDNLDYSRDMEAALAELLAGKEIHL